MKKIYFLGGSPCAGKSTICEIISRKHDLYYFKVDDYLDDYISKASKLNNPLCKNILLMSSEEIWMRDPMLQCDEEFGIYKEIFRYIISDLENIETDKDIITEGCAYVPELIKELGIPKEKYLSIIPTKDFQVSHYKERKYVPKVLSECSNKELAFENWMERDYLFSREVKSQCDEKDYKVIINDGNTDIDEMVSDIVNHFKIEKV